jgi:hypothetical protein
VLEWVRDGQKWRCKRITIDSARMQGDPEILNALASHYARNQAAEIES